MDILIKMKEVFKKGDRIFHIQFGWGVIIEEINCHGNLKIAFDKPVPQWDWFDVPFISFTEYTLQGFSQKRPIELPEVGELCLVKDFKDRVWKAREFKEFKKFTTHFLDTNGERWDEFKRIKILD